MAGKPIEHVDGESAQRAVARWFAAMAANQEFAWGLLDSRRYNKYKMRLEAFVEKKLDRAVAGSLTPGTEVIFSLVRSVGTRQCSSFAGIAMRVN